MELILASNSPRRRHLLGLTGWNFRVIPAQVDELPLQDESPSDYVLRMAELKACTVAAQLDVPHLILAADTTVTDDGEILGKPIDGDEARRMLMRLRAGSHRVLTALAVLDMEQGILLKDLCLTIVPMRDYSDREIEVYIASGDPLDKAGAYAIQHPGFHPVEELSHCYANVVGLPLCHLVRTIDKLGMQPQIDVPHACHVALRYRCPIYESILQNEQES
jgi:MAF protein